MKKEELVNIFEQLSGNSDSVLKQMEKNLKNKAPVILGALGEMPYCSAYVERVNKEGEWTTKYLGIKRIYFGITDNYIIDRITLIKRAFYDIVRLSFPLTLLRKKQVIEAFLRFYRAEGSLKSKCLKDKNFCYPCQEIIRVGHIITNDNEDLMDLVYCLAMFLQYSQSYRFRVQDIFGELNKEAFMESPLTEILRLKRIAISRERDEKKKMSYLWYGLFILVAFNKSIAKKIVKEINIQNMILGNNDWYYCLRRDSYNFKGIKIEERLKEAKRIDDEEGNILLGK